MWRAFFAYARARCARMHAIMRVRAFLIVKKGKKVDKHLTKLRKTDIIKGEK